MNYLNPFPSIKSAGLNSAIQSSVVHPHEGRGYMSEPNVGGVRDLKKGGIDVSMHRSLVGG